MGPDRVPCKISFSASRVLSERFASTPTYQFYTSLPSLDHFATFIEANICSELGKGCRAQASSIRSADSLDIDYDSISHTLTLTGYWSSPPAGGWTEKIPKHPDGKGRVEVGLLSIDKADDLEELKVGGLLGVVGEDEKMSMFDCLCLHDRVSPVRIGLLPRADHMS